MLGQAEPQEAWEQSHTEHVLGRKDTALAAQYACCFYGILQHKTYHKMDQALLWSIHTASVIRQAL